MTTYLPLTVTRYISDFNLPTNILTSPRYAPYASTLNQQVKTPDFNGFWIIRNGFTTTNNPNLDPTTSDIVIYYLHGGGYVTNTPATYTLFLLRLAETITRTGKTVSIFALDYDLAPEHPFPRQLIQARKAYNWLVGDKAHGGQGISRSKILIMGDSAGGHLSLSLLVDLWNPLLVEGRGLNAVSHFLRDEDNETEDLRPGLGVVLMSPWLSLFNVTDAFERNKRTDLLSKKFLHSAANRFLGSGMEGQEAGILQERAKWLEFMDGKKNGINWDEVLPGWVWTSAGRYEVFYDDIVKWVDDRKRDCSEGGAGSRASKRIVAELTEGEVHDYAWVKTLDMKLGPKLCQTPMGDETGLEEFAVIDRIGSAIVERAGIVSGK